MREIIATVTSNGQVTIPVEVLNLLSITAHDKLAFVIDNDGTVYLRPAAFPDIDTLRGAAGTLDDPLSWDAARRIARDEYVVRKFGRRDD